MPQQPTQVPTTMLSQATLCALRAVSSEPVLLRKTPAPATLALLQTQTNRAAQSTGNKVTDQEAAFAEVLTASGFTFLAKTATPTTGIYYVYQPGGSQTEDDFHLLETVAGVTRAKHSLDLKHTLSSTFFLNDGWFNPATIYIISWNEGTQARPVPKTHVALGKDIPNAEESAFMAELQRFKAEKNSDTKKVGSLRPYVRFANKYSCERFDPATAAAHFTAVEAVVASK